MRHISDELPLLLTGDVTRDVVIEAAAHLRVCVDCQQELVSAVIAHASLTSAHRFAPEIVSPEHDEVTGESTVATVELLKPASLPDMSSLFAEARADTSPTNVTDLGQRRMRRRLVAVAAAAAVVVGGGVTYAVASGDESAPAARTVALDGISDATDGHVKLVGNNRMVVDGTALPKLSADHQYEVWLTTDGEVRQPVGYLRDGTAEISVPSNVMSQYKGIAVSVQRNGQAKFSGTVVLRGTYG